MAVKRFKNLQRAFRREAARIGNPKASVSSGYKAHYAIYVHENLEIEHPIHWTHDCGGKAKFLTDPFRSLRKWIVKVVQNGLNKRLSLLNALYRAMLGVERLSELEVPVDTGFLKSTAFTEKDKK